MDKVHGVAEPRPSGLGQRHTRDRRGLLPRPSAQGEPFFPIDPFDLLVIHSPAFPPEPYIEAWASIASLGLGNLANPCAQRGIVGAPTPIPARVPIQCHEPTHPPLTQPKAGSETLRCRFLRLGRYQFFAVTAFSA
jgi:hypothetical protein